MSNDSLYSDDCLCLDCATSRKDARIAALEQQLAEAETKLEKMIQRNTKQLGTLSATKQRLELELAEARERERENVRLLTECNRILDAEFPYSTRSLRAEIAAALAAAQQEGK